MKYINGSDVVISPTRSPYYTITFDMINKLENKPKWIVDLAMTCDVETKCSEIKEVCFWKYAIK